MIRTPNGTPVLLETYQRFTAISASGNHLLSAHPARRLQIRLGALQPSPQPRELHLIGRLAPRPAPARLEALQRTGVALLAPRLGRTPAGSRFETGSAVAGASSTLPVVRGGHVNADAAGARSAKGPN